MALAITTLSAAIAKDDKECTVASATSVAIGRLMRIDGEVVQVSKGYVSGSTTVPILRGVGGTAALAHVSSAEVIHGDADDFSTPVPGGPTAMVPGVAAVERAAYSAAGAIALPRAGSITIVELLGTAIAMTLADPTEDMTGTILIVANKTAAAHTVTVASGLGGGGSDMDVLTFPTVGVSCIMLIAVGDDWCYLPGPLAGTVTDIDISVA